MFLFVFVLFGLALSPTVKGQTNPGSIDVPCPLRCLCFKTTVRCMFLHLEGIPEVSSNTTILDLRFNRIRKIHPNSFENLSELETLLLNNNHISYLPKDAFKGLKNLKYLYLYKNRIKEMDQNVFKNLKNLEQLYLHYNAITEIKAELFSGLANLKRLFLHYNKIQRIPEEALSSLSNLKRLRLDKNALICDCEMMGFVKVLEKYPEALAAVTCAYPPYMHGKAVSTLQDHQLQCRGPTITEGPKDVELTFGNTVYFHCKAEGDPIPKIKWLHNRQEISLGQEPRYSLLNDGTLMIANTQFEDAGFYECVAKNNAGETKSRKAAMIYNRRSVRHMRPRFIRVPTDTEVAEGKDVELNCKAFGEPAPSIRWLFNSLRLDLNDERYKVSDEALMIKNVSRSDRGIYRCAANNSLGQIAAIAELRVQVPPIWVVTPLDQSVILGETAYFKCEAVGQPTPTIFWTLNGNRISFDERVSSVSKSDEGSFLKIVSVKESDEGEYSCIAENLAGQLKVDVSLSVILGNPPKFIHNFNDFDLHIVQDGNIELPCTAEGYPPPTILWRRNKMTIKEDAKHTILPSGTLILNGFDYNSDSGVYECSAFNDHGFVTADAISIGQNRVRVIPTTVPNDSVVINAFSQAKLDVEAAESETLEILFGNMSRLEIKTPIDLLRLTRFPNARGRLIARSAEIYERALHIISQHLNRGMNFSLHEEFAYSDILSSDQLEVLGRLSGCISHRTPKTNCTLDMCFHSKYRSIDGTCNNFADPMLGSSYTPFQRLKRSNYENGFNLPIGWNASKTYNGYKLPSARLVSNRIVSTKSISADLQYTHMLMQWGQFVDHDMDHALPSLSIETFGERVSCRRTCENVAPCYPIEVPPDDPRVRTRKCIEFTRSAAVCGSGVSSIMFNTIHHREQINQLTSFIDASQVYGSSAEEIEALSDKGNRGFMRKGIYMAKDKPLMPFATDENFVDCRRDFRESDVGCFLAGDIRANEQLGLLAMHTIWFRQHNHLAKELKSLNPSWDENTVFQETRKIVGAQMQHITYAHWLPNIIGEEGMRMLGPYEGYDPQINPTITTEFATAAFRFGHTLINPSLRRLDSSFRSLREGDVPLREAFFSPWRLVEEGGIDPLLRGLFYASAKLKTSSQFLNSHLTDELFGQAHLVALDLAAMNIQRGRDHGLHSYNSYREFCNIGRANDFDDLKGEIRDHELLSKLKSVYGHVDNIDLWVGGIAEDFASPEARVGPTFRCILIDQFRRLRDGDRFWYENPSVFRPEQLIEIKQTTLARILCDNGDNLKHVKRDVFRMNSHIVNCQLIPSMQLAFWMNDGSCCSSQSQHGHTCHQNITDISSNVDREIETNEIRAKRSVPVDVTVNKNSKIENFSSKLSTFEQTVQQLKNRIDRLESSCKNELDY